MELGRLKETKTEAECDKKHKRKKSDVALEETKPTKLVACVGYRLKSIQNTKPLTRYLIV